MQYEQVIHVSMGFIPLENYLHIDEEILRFSSKSAINLRKEIFQFMKSSRNYNVCPIVSQIWDLHCLCICEIWEL
jgi:hypothetical protein